MDKYGVKVSEELTKTAGATKSCPECGQEVILHGNVPKCDACGTKPFEDHGKEKEE